MSTIQEILDILFSCIYAMYNLQVTRCMYEEFAAEATDILINVYGFIPYDLCNWVCEKLDEGKSRDWIIHNLDVTSNLAVEIQ